MKELLPALERWEDEIRKHDEITGAAMLNEATKKAIVTQMAPSELARHLRLNADRTDEMAGSQSRQLEVTMPAHNHVD